MSNQPFNLFYVLCLLKVEYIPHIELGEITEINPHSNAEKYVHKGTKIKMVFR